MLFPISLICLLIFIGIPYIEIVEGVPSPFIVKCILKLKAMVIFPHCKHEYIHLSFELFPDFYEIIAISKSGITVGEINYYEGRFEVYRM